jgi:hypothetical protein
MPCKPMWIFLLPSSSTIAPENFFSLSFIIYADNMKSNLLCNFFTTTPERRQTSARCCRAQIAKAELNFDHLDLINRMHFIMGGSIHKKL